MHVSRQLRRWLIIGALGIIAVVVGGPFVYIHFIEGDAPAKLSVETKAPPSSLGSASASAAGDVPLDGVWKVASNSQAGYRVNEVLFGQHHEAVGRTSSVGGQITIAGAKVSQGAFTVDLTTVTSDQSRRDRQFSGRIMDVSSFPTAMFKLTQPIDFGSVPTGSEAVKANATGDLTLKGVTKSVTFDVSGKRTNNTVAVSGSIPVTFADFDIPNPGFADITTDDHGVIEFLLNFSK
jgi:polyisoprenoid-binding protein YceI